MILEKNVLPASHHRKAFSHSLHQVRTSYTGWKEKRWPQMRTPSLEGNRKLVNPYRDVVSRDACSSESTEAYTYPM